VLAILGALVVLALVAPAPATAADPLVLGRTGGGILRFPQAIAHGPDRIYVADQYSFAVQEFTGEGRFVRAWGSYGSGEGEFGRTGEGRTATSGTVGGIGGLAVGPGGDVYVLDSFNFRVQQFTPDGRFKRSFGGRGSAPGQLETGIHGGLAVRGTRLYVADQNNHRIQRFTLGADGAPVGTPLVWGSRGTGPGQFDHPQGVAIDPARDGDVFVADDRNHRVQRFSADGVFEGSVGAFGTEAERFRSPYDVGVDLAGRLYVADNENSRVQRFSSTTLAYEAQWGGFGTAPGQMGFPRSLAALVTSPNGGVLVGDTSGDRVQQFAPDGTLERAWGESGRAPGNFTLPRGVAVAPDGPLLVVDSRNHRVERLRADGSVLATWGKRSSLGHPTSGGDPGEFLAPSAVAAGPDAVWVADAGNHRVQRLGADGSPQAVWGGRDAGSGPGEFREPLGLAVGPDGAAWVADTGNDRLQRLDPGATAWRELRGFDDPAAVAVGADGRIAVAEPGGRRVRVLDPDGTVLADLGDLAAPEGVALDGEGALLVADTGRDRVLRYPRAGAGYGEPRVVREGLTVPIGVAVDAAGTVWVVESYAHRVLGLPGEAAGQAPAGGVPPAPAPPAAAPAPAPAPAPVTAPRAPAPRLLVRVARARDRRAPYRFSVSGRLVLPRGVTRAQGCRGTVALRLGAVSRTARVGARCTFTARLTLPRRGRARLRVSFRGTAALAPVPARTRALRAG